MTSEQYALDLAEIIRASFPRFKISDETVVVWARRLRLANDHVAEEVVDRSSRYSRPPDAGEIETLVRECREELEPELALEPKSTGRIVTLDEWRHGRFHLDRFWRSGDTRELREPDEFDKACHPWECECDAWRTWEPPQGARTRRQTPEEREAIYVPQTLR